MSNLTTRGEALEATPYQLLGALGAGASGDVLLARHRVSGQLVAVKVLIHSTDLERRSRFLNEQQMEFHHPNVVGHVDWLQDRNRSILVMEHADSGDLQHWLDHHQRLDSATAVEIARRLTARGFDIIATTGTAAALTAGGVACRTALKVSEGRPHIVDMIKNDEISLIVNTTEGKQGIRESRSIRREAVLRKVTYYTTIAAAFATCEALDHLDNPDVSLLQDLHRELHA